MCMISLCLSGCGITPDNSNEKTFEAYYQPISDDDIVFEGDTNYVNAQILLTAADGVSNKQVEKLIKKQGGNIVGYISISNDYQIEFSNNKTFEELNAIIADLKSNEDVENATLNYASQQNTSSIDYTKDPWIDANNGKDTLGSQWSEIKPEGNNWWAEAIMLPSVWNMNVEFQPVKVGIYDTMFDTDNEDLQNEFVKIWNNPKDENGKCMVSSLYSSAKQANQSTTNYAHGTHVAGLIAAKAENHFGIAGVSQNAQLYGFSYASTPTDTKSESQWDALFELKYAIALMLNEGIKVINLSISYSELLVAAQHGVKNALTDLEIQSASLEDYLKKCLNAGYDFLIVKCAGNENGYNWTPCEVSKDHPYGYMVDDTVEDNTVYDAQYDFFGAIKDETVKSHILIVGAVENHTNYYKTAEFSTVGKRVDVYAPGKSILSDFPTNITVMDDGTSMSAPIVTGVAALVWGVNPDLSAEQVASIIRASTSVTLFDSESVSNFFHSVDTTPIVNAYFAVQLAQNIPTEDEEEENTSGIVTGMAYHTSGDGSVEAMTGVTITAFDSAGNTIDTVNTSEFSGYSFVLPEGTYTVTAEADGYETESKEITLTKNEVLNVDFEMKENITELTDYYDNLKELIELKGLQQQDDITQMYDTTYMSEDMRLFFVDESMKEFLISNTDPRVSAYGVKIGDSKEKVLKTVDQYGLFIPTSYKDDHMDIYLWDSVGDFNVISLSLTFDSSGCVERWAVCNWPEGESASYYINVLANANKLNVEKLNNWQIEYFNFIIDDYYNLYNVINSNIYQLININNDDVPELYVDYGSTAGGSKIAYFNGNKVITQSLYVSGLTYLEKENLFRDSGGHMDEYCDVIYSIQDDNFTVIASGHYGAPDNSNVQLDSSGNPIYVYYWNDEQTTKAGYQEMLDKSFDTSKAISPFGDYNSSTQLYDGFYDMNGIAAEIIKAGKTA